MLPRHQANDRRDFPSIYPIGFTRFDQNGYSQKEAVTIRLSPSERRQLRDGHIAQWRVGYIVP
jgi:hypothetical protein